MTNSDLIKRICEIKNITDDKLINQLLNQNTHSKEELKENLRKFLLNNLSKLKLHETVLTDFGIYIMKVESGYLYNCWNTKTDNFINGVFVPFKKV